MECSDPRVVWVLGLVTLASVGCGGTPENDLFGGGVKRTPAEAAATGGTPSFGGTSSTVRPADAAPPGSGGAAGIVRDAAGDGARDTPDASGGSTAADAAPPCKLVRFYVDQDGDGFGDATHPVESCALLPHTVKNSGDCYDGNAKAYPGQTLSFDVDRGDGSFDYDCDGVGSPDVTVIGHCGTFPFCSGTPGWRTSSPECGQSGTWLATCTGLTTICAQASQARVQSCK